MVPLERSHSPTPFRGTQHTAGQWEEAQAQGPMRRAPQADAAPTSSLLYGPKDDPLMVMKRTWHNDANPGKKPKC